MRKTKTYHFICLLFALCLLVSSSLLLVLILQLPDVDKLDNYSFELPSQVFDRNEELVGEFYIQKRSLLKKEEIPEKVKQAFIAIEDNNFYQHFGIDIKRIIAALIVDIKNLALLQGASTITQQTAKLFLLRPDKKIVRKIKEILLAFQMEKKYEKDEIFTFYLNKAYMGSSAYGIAAAAKTYFSKDINELDLTEIATLAALVKAPSRLAPTNNIQQATTRKNLVLKQMYKLGFITKEQLDQELNTDIVLNLTKLESENSAAYFIEEVRKKLLKLGFKNIPKSGLKIYTTIDLKLQLTASNVLKKGLLNLDKRHGYKGAIGTVMNEKKEFDEEKIAKIKLTNRYNQLDTVTEAYIEKVEKNKLFINTGDLQGIIFLEPNNRWAVDWDIKKLVNKWHQLRDFNDTFQVGDIIYVELERFISITQIYEFSLYQNPINNGGIIALKPVTGEILAMSGGYSFQQSQFNRATQGKRQPGSAFKPIIYSIALENGYLASSILEDTPLVYDKLKEFPWFPKNYSGNFTGKVSFRESLYKSKNIPTIKLGIDIGVDKILEYVKKFNIQSEFPKDPSVSLGSGSLTLLDITSAYSVLANGGKQAKPYMIDKVLDKKGQIVYQTKQEIHQVLKPSTAYIITNILQDTFTLGTAKNINDFNQPIAGKTGTTNNNTDAWFIGYTPDIVTGVYLGNDNPAFSLGLLETGSRAAAPIWRNFMVRALKNFDENDFTIPNSVEKVKIILKTGLKDCSQEDTHTSYYEYFHVTTSPTQCDQISIYQKIDSSRTSDKIDFDEELDL